MAVGSQAELRPEASGFSNTINAGGCNGVNGTKVLSIARILQPLPRVALRWQATLAVVRLIPTCLNLTRTVMYFFVNSIRQALGIILTLWVLIALVILSSMATPWTVRDLEIISS